VDGTKRLAIAGSFGTIPFNTDPIGAMIQPYDEFGTEEDVVVICKELHRVQQLDDPFEYFEMKYGKGTFNGKRLRFLTDARMSGKMIKTDNDALAYLDHSWAKDNGLRSFESVDFAVRKGFQG
jgi:hypothetical protein